jgi:phospholipid/cholesterol/gamma-HCH transport system substrate-binding protein
MSQVTRAQKVRLGLFVFVAVGILAIVVVVKVGESLFDVRDSYRVRMPGSVGSLDPGAAVTFNGITVGRVERVGVDPDDVGVVAIDLSLASGTPIPEDTRATVAMRGITGMKYVELDGGTNAARRRLPGEEIPAGRSSLDEIEDHAVGIAAKLDQLLGDAQNLMHGPSADHIEATLASFRRMVEGIEDTLATNTPRVGGLIERVDEATEELTALLVEARGSTVALKTLAQTTNASLASATETVKRVGGSLERASASFERVGDSIERLTKEQLTPLASEVTRLARRAGADLRASLDAFVQSLESVVALTDMLRADPSSIVGGRSLNERGAP